MKSIEEFYPELEGSSFRFVRRGISIPGNRRPIWRVGLLCLILSLCCRGKKSSFVRLQILDWCCRSENGRDQMDRFLDQALRTSAIQLDPATLRAVNFGIAAEFFEFDGKRVSLINQGLDFAKEIENSDVYADEKQVLNEWKKAFRESDVSAFLGARK